MLLIRDTTSGAVYIVGEMGKRHIGGAELVMWQRAQIPYTNVTQAEANSVPNVPRPAATTSAEAREYIRETEEMVPTVDHASIDRSMRQALGAD